MARKTATKNDDEYLGINKCTKSGWKMDGVDDKGLIDAIGEELFCGMNKRTIYA